MALYTNCVLSKCISCDLGLFVRVDKHKDCSCFVMKTVSTGTYHAKSILFMKYTIIFVIFTQKEIHFVKVVTVK